MVWRHKSRLAQRVDFICASDRTDHPLQHPQAAVPSNGAAVRAMDRTAMQSKIGVDFACHFAQAAVWGLAFGKYTRLGQAQVGARRGCSELAIHFFFVSSVYVNFNYSRSDSSANLPFQHPCGVRLIDIGIARKHRLAHYRLIGYPQPFAAMETEHRLSDFMRASVSRSVQFWPVSQSAVLPALWCAAQPPTLSCQSARYRKVKTRGPPDSHCPNL